MTLILQQWMRHNQIKRSRLHTHQKPSITVRAMFGDIETVKYPREKTSFSQVWRPASNGNCEQIGFQKTHRIRHRFRYSLATV